MPLPKNSNTTVYSPQAACGPAPALPRCIARPCGPGDGVVHQDLGRAYGNKEDLRRKCHKHTRPIEVWRRCWPTGQGFVGVTDPKLDMLLLFVLGGLLLFVGWGSSLATIGCGCGGPAWEKAGAAIAPNIPAISAATATTVMMRFIRYLLLSGVAGCTNGSVRPLGTHLYRAKFFASTSLLQLGCS